MRATKVNAGLTESNGKLLLGIWRVSLHVTCGLTACTPGSAAGPTRGNEYGKTLPLSVCPIHRQPTQTTLSVTFVGKGRIYIRQLGQLSLASLWGRLIEYQLRLGEGREFYLCRVADNTV